MLSLVPAIRKRPQLVCVPDTVKGPKVISSLVVRALRTMRVTDRMRYRAQSRNKHVRDNSGSLTSGLESTSKM